MNDFPEMMNIRETSDFLRTSPRNVYEKVRNGRLPAVKIGREWRVSKSAIVELSKTNMLALRARRAEKDAAKAGK